MTGTWVTLIALAGVLVLTGFVALDRNRIKRRLDAAEGAVTGLRLDLAAARDRIAELNSADPIPDRWSPGPGQGAEVAESRRLSEQ